MINNSLTHKNFLSLLAVALIVLVAVFVVYYGFINAEEKVVEKKEADSAYQVIHSSKFRSLEDNKVEVEDYELGKNNPFAP